MGKGAASTTIHKVGEIRLQRPRSEYYWAGKQVTKKVLLSFGSEHHSEMPVQTKYHMELTARNKKSTNSIFKSNQSES